VKRSRRTHAIDISSSVRRLNISRSRVREAAVAALAAEKVRDAMISITFVGRAAISALNHRYLGHAGPTDVISFGLARTGKPGAVVGDIYICPEVARANARRQNVRPGEELLRLVIHGTLHVLGYEHPDGKRRTESPMWQRQERILARVL
jgi:probable rRNA maturation factor